MATTLFDPKITELRLAQPLSGVSKDSRVKVGAATFEGSGD